MYPAALVTMCRSMIWFVRSLASVFLFVLDRATPPAAHRCSPAAIDITFRSHRPPGRQEKMMSLLGGDVGNSTKWDELGFDDLDKVSGGGAQSSSSLSCGIPQSTAPSSHRSHDECLVCSHDDWSSDGWQMPTSVIIIATIIMIPIAFLPTLRQWHNGIPSVTVGKRPWVASPQLSADMNCTFRDAYVRIDSKACTPASSRRDAICQVLVWICGFELSTSRRGTTGWPGGQWASFGAPLGHRLHGGVKPRPASDPQTGPGRLT